MSPSPKKLRRVLVTGALATGSMLGAAGIASAATGTTTPASSGSSSSTTAPSGAPTGAPTGAPAGAPTKGGPMGNPATMTHGPGETLLTGTQLVSATTAANAAVPGATVVRAETNSSGGYPYEVHMKKADGTYVTVELDTNFTVITTISGFGAPPAGGPATAGPAPTTGSTGSATSTTN